MKPKNTVHIRYAAPDRQIVNPPFVPREKHEFDIPTRVCNSSTKGLYTGPAWNIRAGGEIHKQFKSKGF